MINIKWWEAVKSENSSQLRSARYHKLVIVGTINLHVRIAVVRVRVVSGVLCYLAVFILFETSFVNEFIGAIFTDEREVVPHNSALVSILNLDEALSEDIENRKQ